jgi:hypothetical protein
MFWLLVFNRYEPRIRYRAQADPAARLAEITVQPNLERELRHVAEELDHLTNEIASDDPDFFRSEGLEPVAR